MNVRLHSNWRQFWRYLWPRRLTTQSNPVAIYRWTFWVWSNTHG